jgi:citrate lyase alpha subunit
LGAYSLTGTPSSYPAALIYRVRQKLSTYVDTDSNIIGFAQYDEVKSVNGKSGAVVLTATDVGALDAVNALTVELLWNQTYPSFYTEMTYDMSDKVTQVDIWESASKITHIFTKEFTYSGNQVTTVEVTHHIDGATLVKTFTYDIDGFITNVTRVYTP